MFYSSDNQQAEEDSRLRSLLEGSSTSDGGALVIEDWSGTVMLARMDVDGRNRSVAHLSMDYVPAAFGRPAVGTRVEVAENRRGPEDSSDTEVIALYDVENLGNTVSQKAVRVAVNIDGREVEGIGTQLSDRYWSITALTDAAMFSIVAENWPQPRDVLILTRRYDLTPLFDARSQVFSRWRTALSV